MRLDRLVAMNVIVMKENLRAWPGYLPRMASTNVLQSKRDFAESNILYVFNN